MTLEAIFYTMGIIFMSIMFIFMIALIILIFYIKNKISDLEKNIRQKVEFASSMSKMGTKAVEVAVEKISDFVEKKSSRK